MFKCCKVELFATERFSMDNHGNKRCALVIGSDPWANVHESDKKRLFRWKTFDCLQRALAFLFPCLFLLCRSLSLVSHYQRADSFRNNLCSFTTFRVTARAVQEKVLNWITLGSKGVRITFPSLSAPRSFVDRKTKAKTGSENFFF